PRASKASEPGPRLAFIHGIGANALSMLPLAQACFDRGFDVNAIDLFGHGQSPSPQKLDLDRALAGLSQTLQAIPGRPILVANSLGGGLSLQYALRHPGACSGLVLLSPAGAPFQDGEFEALLERLSVPDRNAMLSFLEHIYEKPPRYLRLFATELRQRFHAPSVRALLDSVSESHLVRPHELERLSLPVLLIWGTNDTLLPRSALRFFRRHLPPTALIEEPEGYSHSPYFEHPEELAERIALFVSQNLPPLGKVTDDGNRK
ncbi:MAG: alpha/beta hydrolase, partial [Myxococcota bacterium]|nr:alpha/beta hydrolase [Myxococcota bacterium]